MKNTTKKAIDKAINAHNKKSFEGHWDESDSEDTVLQIKSWARYTKNLSK